MMKKLFWLALSTSLLVGQGVLAQEVNSESQSSQKGDSLLQVVNELSSKVRKTEESKLDETIWKKRSKYFSIGYITNQTLTDKQDADAKRKSDFGFSLALGKTYYLHKKPLLNMIKFGIDATWVDLSYAKYSDPDKGYGVSTRSNYKDDINDDEEGDEEFDWGMHQIDFSMHVGPSITVNPINHLKVAAYFHYVPTYSGLLINDSFGHGYVSNFAFGASVSYKVISLGIEHRWAGSATYNGLSFDEDELSFDEDEAPSLDSAIKNDKWKMKSNSFRIFLSLRY